MLQSATEVLQLGFLLNSVGFIRFSGLSGTGVLQRATAVLHPVFIELHWFYKACYSVLQMCYIVAGAPPTL